MSAQYSKLIELAGQLHKARYGYSLKDAMEPVTNPVTVMRCISTTYSTEGIHGLVAMLKGSAYKVLINPTTKEARRILVKMGPVEMHLDFLKISKSNVKLVRGESVLADLSGEEFDLISELAVER